MKIDKVLSLIDNYKLLKVVENCIVEAKVELFEVFVEEYKNTSYDIELEEDFDCNLLGEKISIVIFRWRFNLTNGPRKQWLSR